MLFKRKEDQIVPQPKKLIAKGIATVKLDEMALEFDRKLSQLMLKLSATLKDDVLSESQKWSEIEKSKFLLYSYSQECIIKFINKHKAHLCQKDNKEI